MRGFYTILLLVLSNSFMTVAWYGHLRYSDSSVAGRYGLLGIILASWGIALLEYCFMIPANRIGFMGTGGPFSLVELKVIQEVLSLLVFFAFTLLVFRQETFRLNHAIGAILLIGAVFFFFRK